MGRGTRSEAREVLRHGVTVEDEVLAFGKNMGGGRKHSGAHDRPHLRYV